MNPLLPGMLGAVTANPNMMAQGYGAMPRGVLSSMRQPHPSETDFFRANPAVAGMASEDNRVVLNPSSNLTPREKQSVALNEYLRILMRSNPALAPSFQLSDQQRQFLDSTNYKTAPEFDRAATIAARLFTGDPSAGSATPEQQEFIGALRNYLNMVNR